MWTSLKDSKFIWILKVSLLCWACHRISLSVPASSVWAKERVRFPALLMGSAEDLIKGLLGIHYDPRIFFECRSSRALQVDARCAREKIDSKWRVVKSLEANLLCRLWPSGCSFASESFFLLDVRGVFLVTRSTTLTHVVHCACLPSFAIGAHVSTSANKHAQFSSLVSWNVDFKQPCTFPGLWQGLLERMFQMSRYTESGSGSHIVQIIGQCRWHIKKYHDV